MEKINALTITRLTVCGFKNFGERASFDFGEMTYVTSANGLGKSSIADAVASAGTPFFGDGRGLDRLQNRNMREMEVCVEFADGSGSLHTLARSRKKDTVSITYDGYTVRQSDITAVFGDKDIFLSIFNPLYFIDVLARDVAAAQAFEANKSGVLAIEREKLAELTHPLQEYSFSQELDAQKYNDELLFLENKINALERRVSAGHLSHEQARRLADLQNVRLEYKSKLNALNNISDDCD